MLSTSRGSRGIRGWELTRNDRWQKEQKIKSEIQGKNSANQRKQEQLRLQKQEEVARIKQQRERDEANFFKKRREIEAGQCLFVAEVSEDYVDNSAW